MNAQYWYAFHFNFVVAHYYGAIVFVASLALHVVVKLPVIFGAYRERGWLRPLRDDLLHTRPEPPTATRRGRSRRRRRSAAAACSRSWAAASALLLVGNVGESIGGPLRKLAFLAPRREELPGQQDRGARRR